MEGTAKIGLSNDGPSAYIDFVDSTLFKDMKDPDFAAKNPHNRGCECSDCRALQGSHQIDHVAATPETPGGRGGRVGRGGSVAR